MYNALNKCTPQGGQRAPPPIRMQNICFQYTERHRKRRVSGTVDSLKIPFKN